MALLALLTLFPLTAYVAWAKRPQHAVLFVAFFALLFGPEGAFFKLPLIPPLDKLNLPYVLLFCVALVRWRKRLKNARMFRGIDVLIILAIIGGFVTFATNGDALTYGSWRTIDLPALVINDGIQLGFAELLNVGLPVILGRAVFRTRRDLYDLFHFLIVAGLVQSLFIWIEIRLSPQWHIWVYGYGAHSDFLQTIRWGGYRPMNFMSHGLALSLFMAMSLFSAAVLHRVGVPKIRRFKTKHVLIYLSIVLVVCKSTGSILYGLFAMPLLLRATPKTQLRVASVIALIVALYPTLRAAELVPVEDLVETAAGLSPERAESLAFRFDNEEMLLEKARERIVFGWGGKGRRSIYDDELGKEIAVSDGHWIIVLGLRGAVGFIESFGFLLIPILMLRRRMKYFPDPVDRRLVTGLALMVAICALDLLPNGLFANYAYLLAGALLGVMDQARKRVVRKAP